LYQAPGRSGTSVGLNLEHAEPIVLGPQLLKELLQIPVLGLAVALELIGQQNCLAITLENLTEPYRTNAQSLSRRSRRGGGSCLVSLHISGLLTERTTGDAEQTSADQPSRKRLAAR
jgi:hypothetical protein